MRRWLAVGVMLIVTLLGTPVRAAESPPTWRLAFAVALHGAAGQVVSLEGTVMFEEARGRASGGGSFTAYVPGDDGGRMVSGSWHVLNAVHWRLPREQLRTDRERLDLQVLVSVSLPRASVQPLSLRLEVFPNRPGGWLTVSLAAAEVGGRGSGAAYIIQRPH